MPVLQSRTYSDKNDLQILLDLLATARPAGRITDYPSIVDLHELLAINQVQANTHLWFTPSGQPAGFALVDPYYNLWFEMDPQFTSPQFETKIIEWGMDCIRRAMQDMDEPWSIDASCSAGNADRIALLERNGFVRQETTSLHMARSLEEPIPQPQLPASFTIRPVAGEQEAQALVDLHRAAFGTDNMTLEERLAMMRVPEYEPELDLLAIAPNGRFAAYCMGSISQAENQRSGRNEGQTDPVATHPDFQGCGLAKALLLTCMQKLKERGITTAILGTSSENMAMQRTAQAVGFQIQSTTVWFSKPVARD